MNFSFYQVDSFTNEIFGGNPACVVPLKKWLSDDILLKIAKENAVAETAFFIIELNEVHLRWFTPEIEIDLCGHATLATAHILISELNYSSNKIIFNTMSGKLEVTYNDGFYYLDLPSRKPQKTLLPEQIKSALNIQPKEVFKSRDYMLVYENQSDIESLVINRYFFNQINLGYGGVIVTSKGDNVDFVSRFFTPQATILEDPVTGSSHCTLIPYWSSILLKKHLEAIQLSERGGRIFCQDLGNRVVVGGQARVFSRGKFNF